MKRKIVIAVLGVFVIFIALAAIKILQIRKLVSTPPPPVFASVSSAVAKEEK